MDGVVGPTSRTTEHSSVRTVPLRFILEAGAHEVSPVTQCQHVTAVAVHLCRRQSPGLPVAAVDGDDLFPPAADVELVQVVRTVGTTCNAMVFRRERFDASQVMIQRQGLRLQHFALDRKQ